MLFEVVIHAGCRVSKTHLNNAQFVHNCIFLHMFLSTSISNMQLCHVSMLNTLYDNT